MCLMGVIKTTEMQYIHTHVQPNKVMGAGARKAMKTKLRVVWPDRKRAMC